MTVNTTTTIVPAVRVRACPLCDTPAGQPCQPKPAGNHLARYLDAGTAGQLTKTYMAAVLGEIVVIDARMVIVVPAQLGPPSEVDLAALHEALDAATLAAFIAEAGDAECTAQAITAASQAAALAFRNGSAEAVAFATVLGTIAAAVIA